MVVTVFTPTFLLGVFFYVIEACGLYMLFTLAAVISLLVATNGKLKIKAATFFFTGPIRNEIKVVMSFEKILFVLHDTESVGNEDLSHWIETRSTGTWNAGIILRVACRKEMVVNHASLISIK